MLKLAASQLLSKRVDQFKYKAVLLRYTVGSRQAKYKSYRELIEEDNIVINKQ